MKSFGFAILLVVALTLFSQEVHCEKLLSSPRTHTPFNSSLSLCVIIHLPNGVCLTLRDFYVFLLPHSLTLCARTLCVPQSGSREKTRGRHKIEGHSFTQGFVTRVRPFIPPGSTGALEMEQEKWQTFALLWTKLGIMGCRMTGNCRRPGVIGSIVWAYTGSSF